MQKVSDLPEVLEALRLQLGPLAVAPADGLVHQQPHLLDLGHRQRLSSTNSNNGRHVRHAGRRAVGQPRRRYREGVGGQRLQVVSGGGQRLVLPERFLLLREETKVGGQAGRRGRAAAAYLHLLPDASAAEVLGFVELVGGEAAWGGKEARMKAGRAAPVGAGTSATLGRARARVSAARK